jgi:hypothetical protein
VPWRVPWHALVGALAGAMACLGGCLGGCLGMPWWVPWHALCGASVAAVPRASPRHAHGTAWVPAVAQPARPSHGNRGAPTTRPRHYKPRLVALQTEVSGSALPVCPHTHATACLGGCLGMPWWLPWHALVGALACLGGCHGLPKRVDTVPNFFLPVPIAQTLFLNSL